jgi:hypothetical protein
MSDPTPLPQREDNDDALGLCQAVLFDLDGTLADTAPDLAAAVNKIAMTAASTWCHSKSCGRWPRPARAD